MDSSGLPSLLVEAAKTAAEEDGVACKEEPQVEVPDAKPSDEAEKTEDKEDEDADSANAVSTDASTSKKRPNEETKKGSAAPPPLRRGKWTPEEEAYAARLIVEFKAGLLPLTDGTTLRTFLSKLLNCDPMRISKKFVGSNCIGKQVFRRKSADVSNLTPDQIARTRRELSELEERFLDRVTKGGGSKKGDKYERAEKKMKMTNLASGSSAAAAGHALLGGGGSAAAAGNAGLLAQLQASQPGMFNANDTKLFNSTAAAGLNIPGMGAPAGSALDINALMLQTGMTPDQIAQLAQSNGYSSASLAATAMLDKKRSFDRLMSLDFKSMQSIDNLANLIRANSGLPSQASMGQGGQSQMKNWDWNSGAQVGMQNTQGGLGVAFGNLSSNIGPGMSALGLGPQSNSAFGMLGNYNQNSLLQNPQAQQQGQLPQQVSQLSQLQTSGQGARSGGGNSFESLLQQAQNGTASTGNSVFPTGLMGLPGGLPQHHLMGMGFNNSMSGFAGLPQAGNPMMAALAAQQQMMNQNMLPQQTQFNGLGGLAGGLGGGINLSDPKTAALVQQLLAQQGGGTSAGIACLGAATPAQAGVARAPPAAPQANEQQGPSDDAGHTATV